jgi:hypothetical protein
VRARRALTGIALLALAGCHSSVTEVVIIVDTDLSTPREADALQLKISSANFSASPSFGGFTGQPLPKFPATIGVVPGPGGPTPFSVTATLLLTKAQTHEQDIVAVRNATDVQFVPGQTRAIVLTLLRACACKGTNCPDPATTPACADLVAPTLSTFDPNHIPHVDVTDAGARADGGTDAARDVAADLSMNRDTAADRGAEDEDAPRDVARDLAAEEAPDASPADASPEAPARFARGHACGQASQCQDDFCVDGVCCESKCACGACGADGACAPVAMGTDPRGACGPYTCDGNGACLASCPQPFGDCSAPCAPGAYCDGNGNCVESAAVAGNFCVLGTCTCKAGLTCQPQDAALAGVCR